MGKTEITMEELPVLFESVASVLQKKKIIYVKWMHRWAMVILV